MISHLEIGVDVSEDWFDVCFHLSPALPTERFDNDEPGRLAFVARALAFGAKSVHVAMEHTGGCETALALLCHERGLGVSLVDGLKIARYRESLGRALAKNDRQDARLIARFLHERRPALWTPRPEGHRLLTDLVRHRESLVETRKEWRLRSRKAPLSEFVDAQRRCLLEVLDLQIRELEREIRAHLSRFPDLERDVRLLESVPGISTVSAVRILAEMGPVEGYSSPRQLALAAGLCPIESQSGKARAKSRLFPYGNRSLRNALYMPAIVAIREPTALSLFAKRIRENGTKANKTVVAATMRKMAHVVHGVLASKTPYCAETLLKHMKAGA